MMFMFSMPVRRGGGCVGCATAPPFWMQFCVFVCACVLVIEVGDVYEDFFFIPLPHVWKIDPIFLRRTKKKKCRSPPPPPPPLAFEAGGGPCAKSAPPFSKSFFKLCSDGSINSQEYKSCEILMHSLSRNLWLNITTEWMVWLTIYSNTAVFSSSFFFGGGGRMSMVILVTCLFSLVWST